VRRPLFLAVSLSLSLEPLLTLSSPRSFFHYVPFFQRTFGTRAIPVEFFFLPLAYGAGILALDEARKAVNRRWPKGVLAWLAW